jgi:hypothetical protein
MAKAKKDSAPKLDATAQLQRGLKAQEHYNTYKTQLDPRLDPKVIPTLATDVVDLGTVVPAAKTARAGSKQATSAQNTALETAYNSVTAVRTAVGRKQPPKDVSEAYTVGMKMHRLTVKDVKSALTTIIARATAQPVEAASFGILATDLVVYQAQIAALDAADQAQEKARATAPTSTKARNVVLRRISDAVDSIAGAGILAFANSPTERALFEALIKKSK